MLYDCIFSRLTKYEQIQFLVKTYIYRDNNIYINLQLYMLYCSRNCNAYLHYVNITRVSIFFFFFFLLTLSVISQFTVFISNKAFLDERRSHVSHYYDSLSRLKNLIFIAS